jgi:hypothetical protein
MNDDGKPIPIDANDLARVLAILTVNVVFALDPDVKGANDKLAIIANRIDEFAHTAPHPRNKELFSELARSLMLTEAGGVNEI